MERVTDQERREIARRLREIRPCKSGHIKWWKIVRALGLKQPAGWFGWEKFEPDSANRLADLIEPSCDRDALLEIAEEYEKSAKLARTYKWSDPTCASMVAMLADEHGKFARRIREALGVEHD